MSHRERLVSRPHVHQRRANRRNVQRVGKLDRRRADRLCAIVVRLTRGDTMICLRSLRNSVTYPHFALVAVLIGAPGCITGVIRDAATHAPIEGATVVIEGKCTGSGCQSSSMASTTSDSDGNYVFDAYGDLKGSDQVQGL